jgi:DNA recombination protein RmuC
METILIWIALGFVLGSGVAWLLARRNAVSLAGKLRAVDLDLTAKQVLLSEAERRLIDQKTGFEATLSTIKEQRDTMRSEFQVLATQILEEKGKTFSSKNKEEIGNILLPLREQIVEFRKRVDDVYDKEAQGRAALANELSTLKSLNQKISEDAVNLTRALKGDGKTQGNWGQMALERTFELAGLQCGKEYQIQVNSHDQEGNRFLPDAIVQLPRSRDVVVDAKTSLTAFERYCSAGTDEERSVALKEHLLSIRRHINELSEKPYDNLQEVESLDYVLMFIPIEAAYVVAIKEDSSLFEEAFRKNIILVCPTTLLATLRVIAYSWRLEKQRRNTQEIAEKAGLIYDKLCHFVESFQGMGESLQKAREKYDQALKGLSSGRGNLIKRAEELKLLGVSTKKALPKELLEGDDHEPDVSS